MAGRRSRLTRLAKAILFALVVSLPFLRAWDYGMVNFDDYAYIANHPLLWQGPFWTAVRHFATTVQDAIWMPLTWLSYAADSFAFGEWYGGYHLHSIALHGVNAVLVFLLLREVFADSDCRGRDWACVAGAVLWAMHPLRCESVVLLSSRKDLLSFFWELLALLCWVKGSRKDGRDELWLSFWAMVFFVLGACCKPSVMTFPALCLVLDAFVFRRVVVRRYAVPFAFSLFLGVFASWQQRAGGALSCGADETLSMRLADSVAAFGIYLKNTVWPQGLIVQCTKRWPELPRFLFPGAVISLVYGGYLLSRLNWYRANFGTYARGVRQGGWPSSVESSAPRDHVLAGLLWFAVAVFPMLGLVSFGYHAYADRFTYIPSFGLSVVLAAALLRAGWASAGKAAALALALALGALSWRQTGYWKDDYTLFSHSIEVDGEQNSFALRSLSDWYFEFPHDLEKCVEYFERAQRSNPLYAEDNMLVYIFALSELEQTEKLPAAMNRYWENLTRGHSQEEIACMVRGEGDSRADAEYSAYRACRTAWWLTDPTTLGQAEEYLRSIEERFRGARVYSYLRWRLAQKKHDKAEEAKYFAELMSPKRSSGYVTFRYLRNSDLRK